jgi:uncharacterized membrane protein (DUF2068 family)
MSAGTLTKTSQRPASITAAATLLGVLGAVGLIAAPLGYDDNGASFVVIALVIAVIRFIAAAGVWRLQKWAAVVGFVITALDTLLALGAIFDDSGPAALRMLSLLAVPLGLATLVLLARQSSRRAYV